MPQRLAIKRALIRCDANNKLGYGHLVRSLALASALQDQNIEIYLLIKNPQALDMSFIDTTGVKVLMYDAAYDDAYQTTRYLVDLSINIAIFDGYFVTHSYLHSVNTALQGSGCIIVVIGNYIDDSAPCSLLVRQWPEEPDGNHPTELSGAAFLLLRKHIKDQITNRPESRKQNNNNLRLLVTVGGGNNHYLMLIAKTLFRWLEKTNSIVHIIGELPENISLDRENIVQHGQVDSISDIAVDCDIALSACGGALYELIALGVPTLAFSITDRQKRLGDVLQRLSLVYFLGPWNNDLVRHLEQNVDSFSTDYLLQKKLIQSGYKLIDGNGAQRVAGEIIKMSDSEYKQI